MQDFAAIDFETANNERSSVCSVGVVIVRDGEIVDKFYSLIKPEPEYYNYWCSRVHGLCADDTDNAPHIPGSMGTDRTQDCRSAPCRSQQVIRRELSESRIPSVSDGLSRLSIPLHLCGISQSVAWRQPLP